MPHPVGLDGTPRSGRLRHVIAMFGPSALQLFSPCGPNMPLLTSASSRRAFSCDVPARLAALGLDYAVSVSALQAAPSRRLGPSQGTNSPQDCLCPGSASHLLRSGFLRTIPRGLALAFGSWLDLLTMSPSRYSHRGLPRHMLAPMLGAHRSLKRAQLRRSPNRTTCKHTCFTTGVSHERPRRCR